MSNNEQSMDNCINEISFSEFLTQDEIAIINEPIINSNDVIDKARIFRPISMQATALSRKVIEVPSNQIPCNNLLQQVTIQMQEGNKYGIHKCKPVQCIIKIMHEITALTKQQTLSTSINKQQMFLLITSNMCQVSSLSGQETLQQMKMWQLRAA